MLPMLVGIGKRQSSHSIVAEDNARSAASGAILFLFDAVIFGLGSITLLGMQLRELLIRVLSHVRHLAQECDHIPDGLVVQGLSPRWHRTHFDTVFDNPKCSLRRLQISLRKVRRMRVKALADS